MRKKEKPTIALLGTDTAVGWAILLILREEGYEIRMVEAHRAGLPEDLTEGVDLLLIRPDLIHRRCEDSLAALRGRYREGLWWGWLVPSKTRRRYERRRNTQRS